jgi:type I restriction enzyme, S subunit
MPAGWSIASIADVIREVRTADPSAEPKVEITYFDISSIDNDAGRISGAKVVLGADAPSRARQIVQARDVLFSTVRPNLRAIALVPDVANGIASTGFCVLRAAQSIEPDYLFYYVRSEGFLDAISPLARGSSYPAVRSGDVVSQSIPVAPAAEQRRIVAKLEELLSDLDAGVAELKAAQKKLGQYRQSLLKAAVEGALTAEWRAAQHAGHSGKTDKTAPVETGVALLARILTERRSRWEARQLAKFQAQGKPPPKDWKTKYPEPVAPVTTGLPALPVGWVWASLDQLAEFITSGSRGWADYYAEQGATFIRSQNINKDRLDLSDIAFVNPPQSSEGARTLVKTEDLLLTITGANVGKAARVDVELQEAYVSQHVALIRLVDATFGAYLHLFLTAGAGGRGQLNKEAYGAGKPGLNFQQVGAVVIPLPGEHEVVALIQAISTQFNAVQAQEVAIIHSLKQSAAQRKNILQAAFSGQLVPQDSADEPASALLARIRAERNARETGAARGRGKKKGGDMSNKIPEGQLS